MAGSLKPPDDSSRITIVGRTGSGKTVAGIWHLSMRSFDRIPWIIFDWKRDGLIARLPAQELKVDARPPRRPGLYVIRPLPHENVIVDDFLWRVWERGKTGIYIDEGNMIAKHPSPSPSLHSILIQGRSKRIPVILLSQRPAWLDGSVFTESSFFQVFDLSSSDDRRRVEKFMRAPPGMGSTRFLDTRLPDYNSYWYSVNSDVLRVWRPVPSEGEIISRVRNRLGRMRFI